MAKGNITKRAVDAIAHSTVTSFLWDREVAGFGLKVTPAGSLKYIFQFRLGGREAKVRRVTIGAHGSWTPDAARKEARRLSQLVAQGVDPAAVEQTRRREATELSFPAYAESFIEEYLKPEWMGGHRVASGILRLHVIPHLKQKSLKQITRSDVALIMQSMAGKVAARRNALTVLRRLFRWAVNRGDLETSPIRDMEPPPAPAARNRVLTSDELKRVWAAASSLDYPFGPFVKLLILTGQRLEEVVKLDWRELTRQEARWTLPAKRAKNGVAHEVPLSSQAIAIIDRLPGVSGENGSQIWPRSGWIFSTRQSKPIAGFSAAKSRLDKLGS